jgi:hypothetical protein
MVGPGDEIAAGAGGHSHLRASHDDRERVIDMLKAAYVQGRLARDELGLRVGQVLASRTYADLDALTADIPAGLATAPPPASAQHRSLVGAYATARERAIIATAIFGGLAWVVAIFSDPVAWLPLLLGTGSVFICLFLLGTQQRRRRPGGQVPPRQAISPGPGFGAPAYQLPSGRDPRPQGKADAARNQVPRPEAALACSPCH